MKVKFDHSVTVFSDDQNFGIFEDSNSHFLKLAKVRKSMRIIHVKMYTTFLKIATASTVLCTHGCSGLQILFINV